MGPLVKVVFAAVLASSAIDGHAKANDKCIRMLEARPVQGEGAALRPCPIAIRFVPQRGGPTDSSSAASGARTMPRSMPLADATLDGGPRSSHSTDPARPV